MDWKLEAKEELRNFRARTNSIAGLREEIQDIQAERERIGGTSGSITVRGGGNAYEDRQINMIVRQDKLIDAMRKAEKSVKRTRQSLSVLTEEERRILDLFFISPERDCVEKLCRELNIEQATLYRKREQALRKYTLARYGCLEG